ncbi:pyrroloquinoline quinone biosynthesis peptide chaperone PqqD [Rhodovulum sp. BSW8]|uniref:Pyrroloquinoline quinone biosynthesis protein D n=1 Tax=Rhodovulum visakhapatnamense TaxID=364297 RepID=A0A4R8FSV4_9RHOB|nr:MULTISPECIES: pyrroloquinoline quinone biosynthesis peptide chaperone PqqD [Rhodovulum]RBO53938.1 pyrroloquinoline quinone biosynthesis peptide chaperone PqqD [Rhodovulum sp. BSW8]TDX29735.1 pyrroloquinoline quinone biosynthesis protein D [Rhodovulum visakhapatnamense]
MIGPDDIPVLPRGVRLHRDRVRGGWVLLAPERTLALDETGRAILAEIDGIRSFAAIAAALAAAYDAPEAEIAADSQGFLGALLDRRFLEIRQ